MIPESISRREALVKSHLLRSDRTADGKLAIYTYTDRCVREHAWDEIALNSRGHIFDIATGECVARPFSKFFNLGENEYSQSELFDWTSRPDFYEKMDGWLGTLYRHEGKFKVASRGSFGSSGALWATQWVQDYDLNCLRDEVTLVFEIIEPSHRIILNHGEARLVILAAFDRRTGREIERLAVEAISQTCGIPVVQKFSAMDLQQALRCAKEEKGSEGFVVHFNDGRRVKIKTDWYINLARFMQRLSPINVWEAMVADHGLKEFCGSVPTELMETFCTIESVLRKQYCDEDRRIMAYCDMMLKKHGWDRKQIALNQECAKSDPARAAVFCALDEQWDRLRGIVMDAIYPKANRYVEAGE